MFSTRLTGPGASHHARHSLLEAHRVSSTSKSTCLRYIHSKGHRHYTSYQDDKNSIEAGFASKAVGLVVLGVAVGGGFLYLQNPRRERTSVLDKQIFQDFTIVAKERLCPTSAIFTLRPAGLKSAGRCDVYEKAWASGLWSVEFRQPELQIARSYTPLPPSPHESGGTSDLRFLIRREFKGEVSNYLDRLPLGSTIGVRGPKIEYEIPRDVSDVIFLAGGTSIAPALQMVHSLLYHSKSLESLPRVRVLWANRRREDCVGGKPPQRYSLWSRSKESTPAPSPSALVQEMNQLEHESRGRVTFEYFVDEEGTCIDPGRISRAVRSGSGSPPSTEGGRLLVISGPDGFIKHLAGPKQLRGDAEVGGPLGGCLSRLCLDGWTLVKL
ncbi:MAG: mitochondrial peripheral inner membrane protein [Claussenomyces sp. TS43310]|nr:MAG: mitochondrial peripheral inner membrane protein [Claussenomyces sp. TS43310]